MLLQGEGATRDALGAASTRCETRAKAADNVVVMLVGHGSYDGEAYKLNLPGPDIDGDEFAKLLAAVPARSQLVVNTTSASGAVLEKWAAEGRTLITATRSGFERNATRFAQHWPRRSPPAPPTSTRTVRSPRKRRSTTPRAASPTASRKTARSRPSIRRSRAGRRPLHGRAAGVGRPGRRAVGGQSGRRGARSPNASGSTQRSRPCVRAANRWPNDAYLAELQKLLVQLADVQGKIDAAQTEAGSSA